MAQVVKSLPCNEGELDPVPGLGRSPGEGNGNPLQYLAWKTPWTEEPGGLQLLGSKESNTTECLSMRRE